MIVKKQKNGIISISFKKYKKLEIYISTKKFGNFISDNFKKNPILSEYLNLLNIPLARLVLMQQIHSNKIYSLLNKNGGRIIKNIDGLITNEHNLYIGVKTADCLPIFFYDPQMELIGTVHSGWKGTLNGISSLMIKKFTNYGSQPQNILVVIGPHIHKCCYDTDQHRAGKFIKKFGKDVVENRNEKIFLNLLKANTLDLIQSGVKLSNIKSISDCTFCNKDMYYSYRKDKENILGAMLGIIGLRK